MRRGGVLALVLLCAACSEKKDDGTAPTGAPTLPALSIKEDTPNLLLTWVDARGETHSALRPSEVPQEGKDLVRVVIADREEGTRDPLYVVDLTKTSGDGAFTARVMTRREWESILEKRREAYLGKLAPKPAPPPPSGEPGPAPPPPQTAAPASGVVVVIYGAEWCKPCHQAADYLKAKGIQVIMKDIEESREAAVEMQQKLEKAGRRGGSIPVIDVRGQILVGYSRSELDRAIAKASAGTVL
jgi:glutaredoxin